jgi:hypothetical protein
LYWARELKFGEQPVNTLNYNIRVLGRKGVLVLNFIANMDQQAVADTSLDAVRAPPRCLARCLSGSRPDRSTHCPRQPG